MLKTNVGRKIRRKNVIGNNVIGKTANGKNGKDEDVYPKKRQKQPGKTSKPGNNVKLLEKIMTTIK